ncbi:bifunctional folylpolyglutamate synthase/dihydrofolate synthase [Flavisolibacter nicotianae]|uniref:bifunctional folylpolyglutamate synthase/dihydrofolate synthase n=1 Tax=Flavisolibacter nicotianae TaxID=2364882 RepID=UPI000EACE762|nr:folylpolyglutamate synthase/dihydrofolate synthase family protein [Flavisolibacter nicotianae]
MNYRDTLDYIFQKLPMFSRMGSAAFKKDLTNIQALCDHLGNPEQKFKTIHVAGTNGKGSVSHMLAAIFQTAGYKTGLYTSPHLYDFRERIRLNGDMIPEAYVTTFVERLKPQIETIEPSFFEITVAMAMQFFAEQQVDIAIIEVGLGGRLDSTNIITPELSVITNIGWDHMNLLGNTLSAIAGEKAGIIKPNIPVVIGETLPETKPVFQRIAAEKNAPIYWAEDRFSIRSWKLHPFALSIELSDQTNTICTIQTDLPGIYQVRNVRTVLTAVGVLSERDWNLPAASVQKALQNVRGTTGLGGRWEVIGQHPTVVLEVAHNPQGIGQMMAHLEQTLFRQLHIVIGIVKDKEADDVLRLLPTDATYYFTQAHIPRALPSGVLAQIAATCQLKGDSYVDVNTALQAALRKAGQDDLILVCGSIFLVAEVDKSQYLNSPRRASA